MIVCAESWNLECCEYYNISGYDMYYNNSNINKSDGVVVYIKSNINQQTKIIEIERLKIINTIIKLNNNSSLEISAMYRSHDLHSAEFVLNVKKYLKLKRNVKNHLIIGDYNINILQNSNISQDFLNNFLENGYFPGFLNTTRPYDLANDSGTCIDNIFIKDSTISTQAFKLNIPWPDHFPLFVNINKTFVNREINKKDTDHRINYNKLTKAAKDFNWFQYQIDDPNEAINKLIEGIQKCVEKSKFEIKRNKNKPRNEWITKAILKSCRKKEKLYKKLKKDPRNEILRNEYKNYIKVFKKVCKDAKIKHDKKLIENNSGNKRQLWSIINSKLGRKKKIDNEINEIKDKNKTLVKDRAEIVNIMNKHYCSIGQEMSNNIQIEDNEKCDLPEMNEKTIFIKPTNSNEIKKIIDSLKVKNGGIDKINTKTLQEISSYLAV